MTIQFHYQTFLRAFSKRQVPVNPDFPYLIVLPQVLEYLEHHRGEPDPLEPESSTTYSHISEWDQRFIAVDQEMLFEIILAANFLNIKPLLSVLMGSAP
jgi:hypothetical protein